MVPYYSGYLEWDPNLESYPYTCTACTHHTHVQDSAACWKAGGGVERPVQGHWPDQGEEACLTFRDQNAWSCSGSGLGVNREPKLQALRRYGFPTKSHATNPEKSPNTNTWIHCSVVCVQRSSWLWVSTTRLKGSYQVLVHSSVSLSVQELPWSVAGEV